MEAVVAVAISVLGAVFVGSLVALLVVCRHKYCKRLDLISAQHAEINNPDATLVENMEGGAEAAVGGGGLELDHVTLQGNLDQVLNDATWVQDATGVAPHCLAILKTCHLLTEKLVGMTVGKGQELQSPETLTDLVAIARRIGPRVDDVVRAMYPPLDPRLLEARCSALILQVSHLVLLSKHSCRLSGVIDWVDQSLADVEDHLQVLREASVAYEATLPSPQNTAGSHGNTSSPSAPPPQGDQVGGRGNQLTNQVPDVQNVGHRDASSEV